MRALRGVVFLELTFFSIPIMPYHLVKPKGVGNDDPYAALASRETIEVFELIVSESHPVTIAEDLKRESQCHVLHELQVDAERTRDINLHERS